MTTTHLPAVIRRLRTLAATGAAVVLVSLMVGSLPAGAQTTDNGAGPTVAFCEAWADFQNAQDGADLNTALGAMQAALTPDAPAEVAEAIVTLGQGDLDPGEVQAASDTVAAWADEACAADSTTTTVDTDDGDAPTGGVDTGVGGTATGSGSNGYVLGATVALVAGSVAAAAAANRRRLAHRS